MSQLVTLVTRYMDRLVPSHFSVVLKVFKSKLRKSAQRVFKVFYKFTNKVNGRVK